MQKPISWLPIDSRLISFGHVHGVARVFLTVEMILAVLIVFGTITVVVLELVL